jgi:excisionase family DNA binding protein
MARGAVVQERYVTAQQVADKLGVSIETVRNWLKSGRLRGFMPGGTKSGWRIRESEVERFVKELEDGGRES